LNVPTLDTPTLIVPTRLSPNKGSLSVIIRTYKAAVTTECRRKGLNYFVGNLDFTNILFVVTRI
jgi:hypothetical protein